MNHQFDSVLLIAFGGPTKPSEVRPFLANVTGGRPIPEVRLEAVVHHYELIGGCSPLNLLTERQATALESELRAEGPALPVFVGMRNWHPFLHEVLAAMAAAGHRRAVGLILSPQQTEAGWNRYIDSVAEARAAVGPAAPDVVYAAPWSEHPLFIDAVASQTEAALRRVPSERRPAAQLIFTAHSVPVAMAHGSPYVTQLVAAAHTVAERLGHSHWSVAYQSRSGNPREPWLEPDIGDALKSLGQQSVRDVVVIPIGFVCDHVEVLYDLDIEARAIADSAGLGFVRASAVNDHPAFIRMLADVVRQAVRSGVQRPGRSSTVDSGERAP